MPRPMRTREGVFILAGLLAGVGLVLAISGGPITFTAMLFVASAGVFTAGIAIEILAFLSPRTGGSRHHTSAGVETDCGSDTQSNGEKVDGAR